MRRPCPHGRTGICSSCRPDEAFEATRRRAAERHLTWSITLDEYKRMIHQPCFFCGTTSEPRNLDRYRNDMGYLAGDYRTVGNTVACCWPCNKRKGTSSAEEFIRECARVTDHQRQARLKLMEERGQIQPPQT